MNLYARKVSHTLRASRRETAATGTDDSFVRKIIRYVRFNKSSRRLPRITASTIARQFIKCRYVNSMRKSYYAQL